MCLVTDLQYLQLLLNILFLYLDAIKCSYSKNYRSYTDAVNLICSFYSGYFGSQGSDAYLTGAGAICR